MLTPVLLHLFSALHQLSIADAIDKFMAKTKIINDNLIIRLGRLQPSFEPLPQVSFCTSLIQRHREKRQPYMTP